MAKRYVVLGTVLALLWAESMACAVELAGTVLTVMGERLSIKIDPELLPNPGDKVEVFNTVPGLGDVALDCQWQVETVEEDVVVAVTQDKSRATAQQGYKAVIYSAHPRSTKPPEEQTDEKPEPADKEPPTSTKEPQKEEQPPKIDPLPDFDDPIGPLKGTEKQPLEPEGPKPMTPEALRVQEPWAIDWMAHDILIDFPGGGSSGVYLEPEPQGQAHPSPGRRGVLYIHPAGPEKAAKIVYPVTLQGPAPALKIGLCGNHDPAGDFLLVVKVDGAQWGPPRRIQGSDGWQDLAYDLSPFTGKLRTMQIEIASNDWQHEYAFIDYIRIDDPPAAAEPEKAREQATEPEPQATAQGASVLKTVFADDFDDENDRTETLNHNRFDNWFVRSGEADLLGRRLGSVSDKHGLYVELHGSGYLVGKLQSKGAFRLYPGSYMLEFDLAANPKGAKNNLTATLGKLYEESFALEGKKPFETIRRRIDVPRATNASLVFRLKSRASAGPLLDNIRIVAVSPSDSPSTTEVQKSPAKPTTPYLGVQVANTPDGTARIVSVVPNSPAAKAGLLPQDVVLQINDSSLESEFVGTAGLVKILSTLRVNEPAMFIIVRGTTRLAVWVLLEPKK